MLQGTGEGDRKNAGVRLQGNDFRKTTEISKEKAETNKKPKASSWTPTRKPAWTCWTLNRRRKKLSSAQGPKGKLMGLVRKKVRFFRGKVLQNFWKLGRELQVSRGWGSALNVGYGSVLFMRRIIREICVFITGLRGMHKQEGTLLTTTPIL